MNEMAKYLIIAGLAVCAVGGLLLLIGKIPGAGKLPGDILIKRENFSFYFPLTTCILLSILISVVMHVFFRR